MENFLIISSANILKAFFNSFLTPIFSKKMPLKLGMKFQFVPSTFALSFSRNMIYSFQLN